MHCSSGKYSPSWVKRTLDFRIDQAVTLLERKIFKSNQKKWLLACATLLVVCFYLALLKFITLNPSFDNERASFFEARFFWIIPTLVPMVLLTDLGAAALKLSQNTSILLCSAITFFAIPEILSYGNPSYFPTLIRLSLIFALSFHICVLFFTRHLKFNARLVIFFTCEVLMIIFFTTHAGYNFFSESFWIGQPYRYLFMFTILSADLTGQSPGQFVGTRFFTYIFNPANLITPIPIDYRDWVPRSENTYLKSKALVYLLFGLAALVGAFLMQKVRLFSWIFYHGEISQIWFFGGPASYLYVFFYSYANITIPVALAWWFGFKVPDAYDMPLLATTPQDRWRRWNFLFYNWYFRFVFFPIFKMTKSQFVAIMVTFAATLFIHLGPLNSEILRSFFAEPLSRHFWRKTSFFLAHGLLVYLGMKYQKYLPNPDKISGWIGVVTMFMVMSMVHYIYML